MQTSRLGIDPDSERHLQLLWKYEYYYKRKDKIAICF